MATLKNTSINTTGSLTIPSGTEAQRPGSAAPGMMRLNTDSGIFEYYNGANWAKTISGAFSSISELSGLGLTGTFPFFTTLGGAVDPFPVLVDFDTAGGPYICISFRFNGDGWTDTNFTCAGNTDSTNNYTAGSSRLSSSVNLGLGRGNVDGRTNFHPTYTIAGSPTGGGTQAQNNSRDNTIDYYNHATQSLLTTAQETALRNWVTELSDQTPHAGVVVDSDGSTGNLTLNAFTQQSYYNPGTSNHSVWISSDGFICNLTCCTNTLDESHFVNLWTHNSWEGKPAEGGGTTGPQPTAGQGLATISTKLLIPEAYRTYTYTGGGPFIGTPYSPNARGGQGNFLNDRTFFLVRD